MPTVPQPARTEYLGIGKESSATKGTPVAPPASYIPFHPGSLKYTPGQVLLDDKGARGAPVDAYNQVAGVKWSDVEWAGDVFSDTIGWPIAGVFGEVAVTGTGPYTHTFTTLNSTNQQTQSYTLNDYYSVANRQIPGFQFSEVGLSFTVDSGLLTYSTKGVGFPSTTATKPTASFLASLPFAAWQCNAQIGGSSSPDVMSGEISIKRTVSRIHTASVTSGAPANIWAGDVSVDGKLNLVMESDTEMSRLLVPATTSLDINFQPDANNKFQVIMSKVQYSATSPDLGKDWVELAVSFKALANVTDVGTSAGYGPAKVVLINSVPSGLYI